MPASHTLDRVAVTFDDSHAVADAGLILPATLAQHLGLRGLFDAHVDLGSAKGHAHVGDKAMTLIHSALAGGDSIDDADVLRSAATESVLGHVVLAPSTLGTFLRSFTWGHARQLDVVSAIALGGRGPRAAASVTAWRSRSMSTRASWRPTGWPNRAAPSSPTTTSAGITRCSR